MGSSQITEATGKTIDMSELSTMINKKVEVLEGAMLQVPQTNCPNKHYFSPGVYVREIFMPAGTVVIGHEHKTRHLNIVSTGRARVMMNGVIKEIVAPVTFESEPGVRKVLHILEDMVWSTVHVTKTTDLGELEEEMITKSETFLELTASDIHSLQEEIL